MGAADSSPASLMQVPPVEIVPPDHPTLTTAPTSSAAPPAEGLKRMKIKSGASDSSSSSSSSASFRSGQPATGLAVPARSLADLEDGWGGVGLRSYSVLGTKQYGLASGSQLVAAGAGRVVVQGSGSTSNQGPRVGATYGYGEASPQDSSSVSYDSNAVRSP